MSRISKAVFLTSFGCTSVGVAYLLKDKISGKIYEGDEKLDGKVVIITGANTGLGKEVAHLLAKRNARIVMACRNINKCEEARKEIILDTKNRSLYCRECDLASQESIRSFVDRFKKEHKRLDILINNAGVMRCPKSFTKEGIETQLGVNHMGHFLLTNLLLDVLKASAPSRIVNVSSVAHKRGKINMTDLNSEQNYDPAAAYSQSKLANVLFTKELAKKLEGSQVTVNAVHPGLVDTEITRHMSTFRSGVSSVIIKPFVWFFIKSPWQGAQTIIHTALSPSLSNISGEYISNMEISDVSDEAKNEDLARWLWLTSEKWTKLDAPVAK